jgi:hypothetical protein
LILKPIAVPLVGLPLLCYQTEKMKKIAIYLLVAILVLLTLWFVPFYLLHWMIPSSDFQLTAYFRMAGGMTLFNVVEIFRNTATLPAGLDFLGYLWIPALLIGYYFVYRNPPKKFNELAKVSVALLLIFFLTRTWISEPNVNLVISIALLALAVKEWNFRNFAFLWVLPLLFLILNTSFAQLFFLVQPSIIQTLVQIDQQIRFWRLIARFIVIVIWQVFAWRLVIEMLSHKKNSNCEPQT